MFLCLYSGGTRQQNESLDEVVIAKIGKRASITYIPSATVTGNPLPHYENFKAYYRHYGIRSFKYFAHDIPFKTEDLKDALSSEAVFLSGGNTFGFLDSLRKKKLLTVLKRYVKRGGAYLGQSAGSIIATKDINSAAVGPMRDENFVGLKDLNGLNLADVYFCPHCPVEQATSIVAKFSARHHSQLVVAAKDGGGIIFESEKRILVGPISLFVNGKRQYDINMQS